MRRKTYHRFLPVFNSYSDAYEYRSQIRPLPDDTVEKLKTWLRTKAEEIIEFIRRKSSQRRHKKRPTIIRSHEVRFYPVDAQFLIISFQRDLDHITSYVCSSFSIPFTYAWLSVLNILDGRLRCETMQLTLTRKGTFIRYAALHENGEDLTRYECARCRTVAYCCRGVCWFPLLVVFPDAEFVSLAVHQKMDWSRECFAMRAAVY